MGRTYLVLALANMAMTNPDQQNRYLAVIDTIIDETVRLEETRGIYFFLMDYARAGNFIAQPPRSTFLDGELALMIAARQMVQPQPRFAPLLAERVDLLEDYLSRSGDVRRELPGRMLDVLQCRRNRCHPAQRWSRRARPFGIHPALADNHQGQIDRPQIRPAGLELHVPGRAQRRP